MAYQKTKTEHILSADLTGDGDQLATANTGTKTTGNLVSWDASDDLQDAGVASSAVGKVSVAKEGTLVGTRGRINLIAGSNITLTVTDDSGSDEIDVTVTASAGSVTGFASILNEVYDWYAANNASNMDHKITSGNYIALIHHDTNATSGYNTPSTATHTVTTGKKALVLWVMAQNVVNADPTNRGMRLYNSSDAADIIPKGHFLSTQLGWSQQNAENASVAEVAAGKVIELHTWNNTANNRSRGGFVILQEVAA